MNRRLCAVALFVVAIPAFAGETWIAYMDGRQDVLEATGPQGSNVVTTFVAFNATGSSQTQVAVTTYDREAGKSQLRLFDRKTRRDVATWPIPGLVFSYEQNGPSTIVFAREWAYLLMQAWREGSNNASNDRGGHINLAQVSLRDGHVNIFEMDNRIARPIVTVINGVVLVADPHGDTVLRLSQKDKYMIPLIGKNELGSIHAAEKVADDERQERSRRESGLSLPPRSLEYVLVPGAGVYRRSRSGVLHRLTGPDLKMMHEPFAALDLGPPEFLEGLMPATSARGPAIAVFRNRLRHRTIAFVDAVTMKAVWQADLGQKVELGTLESAGPDAVMYVEASGGGTHSLTTTDRKGTRVLRAAPKGHYDRARLVAPES